MRIELKKGRWEKRWLAIEGDAVTHRKSEGAKERTTLCGLGNWELYNVPTEYNDQLRPPKTFAFAFKTTDRLEMFENAEDAMFYVCVKSEEERRTWLALFLDAKVGTIPSTIRASQGTRAETSLRSYHGSF